MSLRSCLAEAEPRPALGEGSGPSSRTLSRPSASLPGETIGKVSWKSDVVGLL